MSIRQRIAFLVGLSFAALLLIGGFAVVRSKGSEQGVRTVTEGVVPGAIKSVEMLSRLKDVQISAQAMVAATDRNLVEQISKDLGTRKDSLKQALSEQLGMADSEAQRGLVNYALDSLGNYLSAIDDTANLKLQGKQAEAEAWLAASVDQYLREQGEVMQALQVEKTRRKDEAIASMNSELHQTTLLLSLVTVLSVLSMGGVGYVLYRKIVLPLGDMESKMTEVAESQDFTHRLPQDRSDEIGRSMKAFNQMIEKIQESTEQVRQKTADIHAMLENVPQGILTIQPGGTIHPEYSSHLKVVLESDDLAGRPVMQVLFEGSSLGADALSQVEAGIGACIGEDLMNFEFNAHVFPREIIKRMPSGISKVIDLNWSAIADEGGVVSRLLLCARDVTAIKALEQEARNKEHELAIIGELLGVKADKFDAFIAGANRFLSENARIISSMAANASAKERVEAVGLLFRNMHTIKGNARTYGLKELTNVVHEVEHTYDEIRHGHLEWDTERLSRELDDAATALEDYARINREKLGRGGAGAETEAGNLGESARRQMDELVARLMKGRELGGDALAAAVQDTIVGLKAMGTHRLEDVLSEVTAALPSLAAELGKPAPTVVVSVGDVRVGSSLSPILKDAFMHLTRNAIDHGIEPAEHRLSQGKPEAGTIHISVRSHTEGSTLVLRDDGRGLALQRIRQLALEKGLLDPDETVSAQELAQFIFKSGFSTADKVTAVSGRGVGMDAARGFIQAEGGRIEVVLLGPEDGPYCPFEVHLSLPESLLSVWTAEPKPPMRQMEGVDA